MQFHLESHKDEPYGHISVYVAGYQQVPRFIARSVIWHCPLTNDANLIDPMSTISQVESNDSSVRQNENCIQQRKSMGVCVYQVPGTTT